MGFGPEGLFDVMRRGSTSAVDCGLRPCGCAASTCHLAERDTPSSDTQTVVAETHSSFFVGLPFIGRPPSVRINKESTYGASLTVISLTSKILNWALADAAATLLPEPFTHGHADCGPSPAVPRAVSTS